jgi:hypothetical protein
MSFGSKIVAKSMLKAGGDSLASLADTMGSGPSRLALLIQAFAPESVVSWFQGHRLRVRQVKAQEQIFDEVCKAVIVSTQKRLARYVASPGRLQSPSVRSEIETMQGDMRLLSTLRDAVRICDDSSLLTQSSDVDKPEADKQKNDENLEHEVDAPWWDMFEALARRRNEDWRRDLLVKALVQYDRVPGSISLKAIWEIGMIEADDVGCLASFCDSALHIDGKPVVLIETEQQAKFHYEVADGVREVNLAHTISELIVAGLVSQATTQFSTNEPVRLEHLNGPTWFLHQPVNQAKDANHDIQINGFFVNDVALDICKLYEPKLNIASNASFEEFRTLLSDTSKEQPEVIGKVKFQKRKPAKK